MNFPRCLTKVRFCRGWTFERAFLVYSQVYVNNAININFAITWGKVREAIEIPKLIVFILEGKIIFVERN